MSIPKRIHQIWTQGEAHFREHRAQEHEWSQGLQKCFPAWSYKLWDETEIGALIRSEYPQLTPLLEASPKPAFTADLGRAVILHKFGGLYIDTDYLVLKSFEHLIQPHNTFGCLYYDTWNAFDAGIMHGWRCNTCIILSAPGSPILTEWMAGMIEQGPYQKTESTMGYGERVMLFTYDRIVKAHFQDEGMLVISNTLLEPLHALNKGHDCATVEECKSTFPTAFAVHKGEASWVRYPKLAKFGSRVYSGLRDHWQTWWLTLIATTAILTVTTIVLLVKLLKAR